MITRRRFLGSMLAAPALVRASSLDFIPRYRPVYAKWDLRYVTPSPINGILNYLIQVQRAEQIMFAQERHMAAQGFSNIGGGVWVRPTT